MEKENEIFNRIGEVMDSKGVTQTWLAEQLGCTINSMNRIYLNKVQPRIPKLFKIANLLDVPAHVLLASYTEEDKPTDQ